MNLLPDSELKVQFQARRLSKLYAMLVAMIWHSCHVRVSSWRHCRPDLDVAQ